jgi:hypothetical protein
MNAFLYILYLVNSLFLFMNAYLFLGNGESRHILAGVFNVIGIIACDITIRRLNEK